MAKKSPKIAREARIAYEAWQSYFKYNKDQYHLMHEFVLGQQWTEDEEDVLVTNKKIPLTANKLAALANSLLGEQQQNTPQLQVVPMTNCDEETAQIRELIIKDIVFGTEAIIATQVAASQAIIGGFGAKLVSTYYKNNMSFDQDICISYFKDATKCFWDSSAEMINKIDSLKSGFETRLSRPKFRLLYGKDVEENILKDSNITATKEEIALATDVNISESEFSWADESSITVLDYFKRIKVKDTLYKLSNGRILNQEEMDELIDKSIDMSTKMQEEQMMQQLAPPESMQNMQQLSLPDNQDMPQSPPGNEGFGMDDGKDLLPPPNGMQSTQGIMPMPQSQTESEDIITLYDDGEVVRIEDSRPSDKYKVMHYKISGDYVLEKTEFPAEYTPVIFMDQNSYYDKNGKQCCRSFFQDVKDTQRYINYLRTQAAYILKVSRYDQWIGSKKNVQGTDTQRMWKDPQAMQGMLIYDESPSGAKPEQLRPPELSASLSQQYQMAIEDLYTSTGLYPTRMGQQGNEVSGAAIDARTRQGSYPTYVVFNSINRADEATGIIVNQMIPRVYDAQRVISLMTPDKGMQNITLNEADEYGEHVKMDIRKGTYEVRLKPGPSFEGQKQQALESLKEVLQASPETFAMVADLYADNLPLANNIELRNRLKTLVPPQIVEAGKSGKMPHEEGQQGPSPQEQAMQMQMQMQQMEMQIKQKEIEIKERELQLKEQQMQMDAQIEAEKLQTERMSLAADIEEQKMRYMAETQRTESDAAISHADNLVKILTHKVDFNNKKDE